MPDTLATKLREWADNISPGGSWSYGGYAGLWCLALDDDRSDSSADIGFRPEDLSGLLDRADRAETAEAEVARLQTLHHDLQAGAKALLACVTRSELLRDDRAKFDTLMSLSGGCADA